MRGGQKRQKEFQNHFFLILNLMKLTRDFLALLVLRESHGWDADNGATHLRALPTGRALSGCTKRSIEQDRDYKGLKLYLLHEFRLTVECHRGK